MKIYLAYSAVGGWAINSLSLQKKEILTSFYYDEKEIKELSNENISSGYRTRK